MIKTVQVYKKDTDEIIASFTEYGDGVKRVVKDGYAVMEMKPRLKVLSMTNDEVDFLLKTLRDVTYLGKKKRYLEIIIEDIETQVKEQKDD